MSDNSYSQTAEAQHKKDSEFGPNEAAKQKDSSDKTRRVLRLRGDDPDSSADERRETTVELGFAMRYPADVHF